MYEEDAEKHAEDFLKRHYPKALLQPMAIPVEEIVQSMGMKLFYALDELTDEKLRACKMVANGESQREVAEELGISRRTLRDRKDSAMKELGDKLKDYK